VKRLVRADLRRTAFVVLATVCLVVATPATIDSARWWRSPRLAGGLQLSLPQIEALDGIYDRMTAQAGRCASLTIRAHQEAQRLLASEATQDALDAAAVVLADAESEHRRTRTLGLYEMFRVLTPDQRAKLVRLVPQDRRGATTP
jgi:Spy/CpxP family protein refolding chaperone